MDSRTSSDQTGQSVVVQSTRVEATQRLGRDIGRALASPMLVCLIGTLGCGKTAFVQGLAEGLDVPQQYYITSPTFTLVNEYPGRLPLYHVDLYRLDSLVELEDIGLEEILSADGVIAVEWAEKLPAAERSRGLTIRFEVRDVDLRSIELIACGQASCSLLKAISH
jgi:tRNA threonylcarbamoyladenosine biosynthesis protein TsaE